MKIFWEMCLSAWSFVIDPEARVASEFKYPSGNPMCIREARQMGKITGERNTPTKPGDVILIALGLIMMTAAAASTIFLIGQKLGIINL